MKIEVNLSKRVAFAVVAGFLILAGVLGAIAYNSNPANPAVLGHSLGEIDGFPTCTATQALTRTASGWSCVGVVISGNYAFGGMFEVIQWPDREDCATANPLTGACTCPAGFTRQLAHQHAQGYPVFVCYKS